MEYLKSLQSRLTEQQEKDMKKSEDKILSKEIVSYNKSFIDHLVRSRWLDIGLKKELGYRILSAISRDAKLYQLIADKIW